MLLLCSCCLWLPGTHVCYPELTWVRHKDGWPDPYPPCRGGRGVSEWLSINSPVPPTWNHTALALAPILKTAHSVQLSYSEMTALQMKPGAVRERRKLGFRLRRCGRNVRLKGIFEFQKRGMNFPAPAQIIDQSNIHESLYQPAWQSLCDWP